MVVRNAAVFAATLFLSSICLGQAAPDTQTAPQEAGPGATVLQAGTRIVVLDVVVQDGSGKPIHGLKASNFKIVEGSAPQQIRRLEDHTPPSPDAKGPDLGVMPPGTFTNYTPMPPGSTLNILLLDALNTPMMYQTWIRDQLKKYVNQAAPGQRIAIFGLTDELILLQGFTADPAILKDTIDNKLDAKKSVLLHTPQGNNAGQTTTVALRRFEREASAIQTDIRIHTTLDAFNALAHYLAAFPGRKNLIWFSGSFPTGVFAGPGDRGMLNTFDDINEVNDTTAALSSAQVAIYPVDARGLMPDPTLNPANDSANAALTTRSPRALRNGINQFFTSTADEHATMETLAHDTGGHAFYNTNGIVQAVQEAITSGSNYYTLTYSPSDHNWNGKYRSIHVTLVDAPVSDAKLAYRPGYFALPPKQPRKEDPAQLSAGLSATDPHHDLTYDRAAFSFGAPTPQDVIFKVRVLPASTELETKLAAGNTLNPADPAKGPFHRYDLDYALQASELTLASGPDGVHTGQVKFNVYVYDAEGKLLVTAHKGFSLTLKPDLYAKFIKDAVQAHMEISVPDKVPAFLRIAVQDIPSDRLGVVEIPTASVEGLPPAPRTPRPAAKP